jgi:hypothetical protein
MLNDGVLVIFVKNVIGCHHLSSEHYYISLRIITSNGPLLSNRKEEKLFLYVW